MTKNNNALKPINTPLYSYWNALYLSFYSRRLFIDVGKRWKGLNFAYLLLVLAILCIPLTISIGLSFNHFYNQQLLEPLEQLPTIYVQNGQASVDKPMPYFIKNEAQQIVIIVDTTDSISTFSNKYPYLNILINKDKLSYRIPTPQLFKGAQSNDSPHIPITQSYGKETNTVFDGKKIIDDSSLTRLKLISQLMIYPIVLGVLFSFLITMFVVIALMGQIFARVFFSFQLTYAQACRLLIVSATPMLLVLFICLMFDKMFPGLGLILIAFVAAYFGYAVSALKSESMQVVAP